MWASNRSKQILKFWLESLASKNEKITELTTLLGLQACKPFPVHPSVTSRTLFFVDSWMFQVFNQRLISSTKFHGMFSVAFIAATYLAEITVVVLLPNFAIISAPITKKVNVFVIQFYINQN